MGFPAPVLCRGAAAKRTRHLEQSHTPAVVSSSAGSTLRMRSAKAVPSERCVPLADSLSAASRQSEISLTREVRDLPIAAVTNGVSARLLRITTSGRSMRALSSSEFDPGMMHACCACCDLTGRYQKGEMDATERCAMDPQTAPESDAAPPPDAAEAEVSTSSNGAVDGEDLSVKFSHLMQKSTEE